MICLNTGNRADTLLSAEEGCENSFIFGILKKIQKLMVLVLVYIFCHLLLKNKQYLSGL